MKSPILPILCLWLANMIPTRAAQLAIWDFNTGLSGITSGTSINATTDTVTGVPTVQLFNQAIDANGKGGISYTDSLGVAHPSPVNNDAIAWDDFRGPGTDGELKINLNSTGFQSLALRFDIKENDDPLDSSTRYLVIDYSTDGVNFLTVVNLPITNNNAFSAQSVDLSGIPAVNNAPNLVIRLSQGGNADSNALNDSVSFDNIEITGTSSGGGTSPPVLTASGTTTARLSLPADTGGAVSGVISDPTDPAANSGISFDFTDPDTTVGNLTFTAASSNTTVVPNANLLVTGSGASRLVKISPAAVGLSTITLTVTDPQLNSDTYVISYAASAASFTAGETRYHTGASDASAAVPISPGLMLVGNDEDEFLRLYDRANSGLPLSATNLRPSLGIAKEADIEAAVHIGNRIYWIGSHGNGKDGDSEPTRNTAFATDLSGSGAATVPVYVNKYTGLRNDLINWDNANGHGLGASALGLAASATAGVLPTVPNGFNLEAATLAPNGSTILLGFRAPLQNTANRNRALVIPALNLTTAIDSGGGPVTFGPPVLLDLGGRAIRSMDTSATGQILILAGPAGDRVPAVTASTFKFFLWDGISTTPLPLASSIDDLAADSAGSPESVFDLPAILADGSSVGVLVDNGSTDHYATGQESKDLTGNWQKFRADTVFLSGIPLPPVVVTTAADSGPGSLREIAATAADNSTVVFDPALTGQTITLTTGQIQLLQNLTIDASALPRGITIASNGNSRIFAVGVGRTVTLESLTLRGGNADSGGGIFTQGKLTVSGCTLTGNSAQFGGAIYSTTNSSGLTTTLINSTVTGNSAANSGGAVHNDFGRTEIIHSTITANTAPSGAGGGVASYGDNLTQTLVGHSIVSGNPGGDTDLVVENSNSFISGGSNLVGNGEVAAIFIQPGDLTAVDPLLAPLGNYGGPTRTMRPLSGSPAVNPPTNSFVTTDQRGFARDFSPDRGAVERGPELTVTNNADSGPGSLRDTLAAVTALDTRIGFVPGLGGQTITLTSGELFIPASKNVEIDARTLPNGIAISGNNASRILSGEGVLGLHNVTLRDGMTDNGAAISVAGNFLALDCTFRNNTATNAGGAMILLSGSLDLIRCTFSQNTADDAGALFQQGDTTARLTNCTISGNQSSGGFSTGAITCLGGSLKLTHCTITGNTGNSAGGGLYLQSPGNVDIERSIIAGNIDPGTGAVDIFKSGGTLTATGPSLIGSNQSVATEFPTGPLAGTAAARLAPGLAPLGNYGGLTLTAPPFFSSPAIGAAGISPLATDQRGLPRDSLPDLGAAEDVPAIVTHAGNSGPGSLRDTILTAAALNLSFDPAFFNGQPGDTITLAGEISITRAVGISASNIPAGVTISGNNASRVLAISNAATVVLDSLTVTSGNTGSVFGGGILISGGANVELNNSLVTGNTTTGVGGGIMNIEGDLKLTNSTVAHNTAGGGAAIWLQGSSSLALVHSTITANTGAEAIVSFPPISSENSIIAGNSAANLVAIGGSTLTGNNLTSGDPRLAPLGNYGGPTRTMPPLPGSPAIEGAILLAATPATDALENPRPAGPLPDLGAVEAVSFGLLPLASIDGDTIPDILEGGSYPQLSPLVNDSARDSDGDGQNDQVEIAAMTDPLDPRDSFRILSFVPAAGFDPQTNPVFDVTVRTFPGLSYLFQPSSDLTSFGFYGGPVIADDFTLTIPAVPIPPGKGFLRVNLNTSAF